MCSCVQSCVTSSSTKIIGQREAYDTCNIARGNIFSRVELLARTHINSIIHRRYLRHRSIKTERTTTTFIARNTQQQANSAITVVPQHEDGTTNCCIVVLYGSNKADGSIH